jgi:23S rRNA (uracil1939-C5)-methyltransferase
VADLVVAHVDALLREVRPEIVIDAYAGVGVFALAAAAAGVPEVYGVETDVRAVEAARVNAARLGLDRVRFAARGAASFLKPRLERYRDAKAVLVLDPPRRGLEPGLREALCRRGPPCILYVSCAPDTLSRDLAFLGGGGYVARSVTLFDMFPRTACFETVVELHREADRCAG